MTQVKKTWQPYSYQKAAVVDLIQNKNRKLWFFPGEGKTSCTLAAIGTLMASGDVKKTLVVAPLSVAQDTWPKEIEKWDNFSELTFTILHGKDKEKNLRKDVDIYIINFEGLRWLLNAEYDSPHKPKFRRKLLYSDKFISILNPDLLVIDELSKCKDPFSLQTKAIRKLAEYTTRHIGLTGTPAANSLMDVFGQTLVMDGGKSLGTSITRFKKEFFIQQPYGFKWDIRHGADREIKDKIAHLVTQKPCDSDDTARIPELKEIEMTFELPTDARQVYDELKKDFISYFKDNEINAANAAAKTIKLRQIASGGLYLFEKKDLPFQEILKKYRGCISQNRQTMLIHSKKAEMLNGLILGHNNHPLLVFYHFMHDVESITNVLGNIPILDNDAIKNNPSIINDWNAGKLPVLLAHPKSVGYGLNLQESGANVCFYTLDWSYELYEQALRRVLRQGNPNKETRCYYLLANDTIEDYVLRTLRNKEHVQKSFMQLVLEFYNDAAK